MGKAWGLKTSKTDHNSEIVNRDHGPTSDPDSSAKFASLKFLTDREFVRVVD